MGVIMMLVMSLCRLGGIMLCSFVGIKDQRCSGIPCVVGGFLLTK